MKTFNLPDLGEGLPEAEIVSWHVKEGDTVRTDEPLVSVETAKAVVEVPSPYTGVVARLYAGDGDIVETGKPLIDIDTGEGQTSAAGEVPDTATESEESTPSGGSDTGTVVGAMPFSDELVEETAIAGGTRRRSQGRVKAAPAVRALARKLGVDLKLVSATGRHGRVTSDDVRALAERGTGRSARPAPQAPVTPMPAGSPEPLRGPRRAMAQSMSASRDAVCPCTIFDDADIHGWLPGQDITARLLRAMAAGCRVEPALNGFYDGEALSRQLEARVDIAIAVDTPDGLIVPVIRGVEQKDAAALREDLNRIKIATRERTVKPEEMRDFTITLSNFGMMAGRYATPVVVPPTIAIMGSGGIQHDVVPVLGGNRGPPSCSALSVVRSPLCNRR